MTKYIKILKIVCFILFIVICVYLIKYLLPLFTKLSTVDGQQQFQNLIKGLDFKGVLLLFILQLAQMFLFIIPGEPIEILAGMCYGTIGGTIFILVSVFIITVLIFNLSKKIGKPFIYEFFNKQKVDKLLNNKIFNDPNKVLFVLFILFFIPGTPKDLLVFIGGLLPVKPWEFILISTFGRFPSIISSTLAGSNLALGDIKTSIIVYLICFIIVGVVIFIINIFNKNTKEAIKSIR